MSNGLVTMGLDPGARGAIAVVDGTAVEVWDMPTDSEGRVDAFALLRRVLAVRATYDPVAALLERVGARPHDTPQTAFALGYAYSAAELSICASGVPVLLRTPQTWRRGVGLPIGADKAASRALAQRIFPADAGLFARDRDDGRAEAALMAVYCQMLLKNKETAHVV